jgi:hypothetical protein
MWRSGLVAGKRIGVTVMNPVLICLGSFILMSFLSTLLFVAASMNSSRISQAEEGYEPEPTFHGHPVPARSES